MNVLELCTCCFPGSRIDYVAYAIIQSYLCHSLCYLPHIQIACVALVGKREKYDCFWLVLELNLHSTRSSDLLSDAYAVVLDKRKLLAHCGSLRDGVQVASGVLKQNLKFIFERLTPTDLGKPFVYSYRSNSRKPAYIINPHNGDVLYSLS